MKKLLPLETPRLILRDYASVDWKAVHSYASDPKVVQYMIWGPNSPSQTRAFIKMVRGWALQKPRRKFDVAVILKDEGKLIGGCGIRIQDAAQRTGDMGYAFHPRHWGKGYATEAAKALIQFGFSKLKMHRIWATCDTRNTASARVLEKTGMKREGALRGNVFQKGAWRDSYLYAVLERKSNHSH